MKTISKLFARKAPLRTLSTTELGAVSGGAVHIKASLYHYFAQDKHEHHFNPFKAGAKV